jgi:laminin alpha 3/5
MLILDSLTELKIRASYLPLIKSAELINVEMDHGADQYEHDDVDESRPASTVERCNCPPLHRGLSCESCAPGYYKHRGSGMGAFTCVPCNCNGKSDVCDEDTGECLNCEDNTMGKNCELCKPMHYAVKNGENGLVCRICPCPGPMETNVFATGCMFDENANKVYYCSCLPGYTGQFCERCAPGFYGDPVSPKGKCLPCQCNQNIDMKDFGSCDQRTGACLKCLNNTAGLNCEKTAPWHIYEMIFLATFKKVT